MNKNSVASTEAGSEGGGLIASKQARTELPNRMFSHFLGEEEEEEEEEKPAAGGRTGRGMDILSE
jgi:hypothetical protein